ncbi:hypothetical protein [Microvirga solisilvae]|uniref:hypothetical protein n=1 Tax=Microvirga solisilvae TaxID=2919498 RepID=UPI001FB00344|nr:hypothetical protein [Microvirga solisilvae]
MKLEKHVLAAINDYEQGSPDLALMHACFSIEGTARKFSGKNKATNKDYKDLIRAYYWIIEPMIGGGINLVETKWHNLKIDNGYGRILPDPDLADVIYHVFRCSHAHAEDTPKNYELLPVTDGHSRWILADGVLHMPERIIWALLAVSVFAKVNADITTDTPHYLTWGSMSLGLGIETFIIKEWWGREEDFKAFMDKQKIIRVKLDKLAFSNS